MEPQIRYVRSADGTSIATASLGAGPSLLWMIPNTQMSLEGYFASPGFRATCELIADRFRVVLFDPRGLGLSDRDVVDLSLDARVADLKAIQESLGEAPCHVLAHVTSCPAAIAFAARYPESVRRLVLWGGLAKGHDMSVSRRRRILAPLIDLDWEVYCKTVALTDYDWTEHGRIVAIHSARSLDAEMFKRQWAAFRDQDALDLAGQVRCPTMVVHPGAHATGRELTVPFAAARRLASAIPGAHLQTGEDISLFLSATDVTDVRIILEFLGADETELELDPHLPSGTAIILFTDIVDSTALTERMGDARFRDASRSLDAELRAAIRDAGGAAIDGKLLGDGVLATFASAAQAIDAARRCLSLSAASELGLHIGLHAGDVIREDNNVFGGAVNIASRICGLSAPGEILVSDVVRGMARSSAGVEFEDRGEQEMKGVGEPVRVYAVRGDRA